MLSIFSILTPLKRNSNLFRTPSLLVLLNNSDSALLLSPPLYQKKWREGSNAHCLGSVSLFMNQRMLDHDCLCTVIYDGAKLVPQKPNVVLLLPLRQQYLLLPAEQVCWRFKHPALHYFCSRIVFIFYL